MSGQNSAIVILEAGEEKRLSELPDIFINYWSEKIDQDRYVSSFLAPNMAWLADFDYLKKHGVLPKDVTLMTRVIIAGVNDGLVPPLEGDWTQTADRVIQTEHETHERALLYVAATRAKKEVLVTSFGTPSRFLPMLS